LRIRVRTFVLRSNSVWVTRAANAAAAKKSAVIAVPEVWLAWPHSASAPSKRFPYRSAATCVAAPPIDWPVT
jgi:hypothetical protein